MNMFNDQDEWNPCPKCGCDDWETTIVVKQDGSFDGTEYEEKSKTNLLKFTCNECGYEEIEEINQDEDNQSTRLGLKS